MMPEWHHLNSLSTMSEQQESVKKKTLKSSSRSFLFSTGLHVYIDSEINHIRHFIKIQFVNKGIEFINLPSIFKDKSVISSIPTYFENKESPIICYKYNKPIRSTVFNYNKLVTELDIENSIPDS